MHPPDDAPPPAPAAIAPAAAAADPNDRGAPADGAESAAAGSAAAESAAIGAPIELDVPVEAAGERLDRFLAAQLAGSTRSQLQRLIRGGQVTITAAPGPPHRADHAAQTRPDAEAAGVAAADVAAASAAPGAAAARPDTVGRPGTTGAGAATAAAPVQPRTPVRAGDRIRVVLPPPAPAAPRAEAIPVTLLYDDADLVVVDKPAGMVVHPAAGHADGTLVNALLHHVRGLSGIGGARRPGIVHRLDRGTSGVMVVAKHDQAHAELARQFQDRKVDKEYVALVWGRVEAGRRIDLPVGRDARDRKKMSVRARRAREAVTRVTAAEPLDGVTLIRAAIATGRTHQIRVHLSAIGHPVVGDSTYGGVRRHPPPHLRCVRRLDRPFLHAARLAFTHPRDGRRIEVSCDPPADLQEIAAAVRAVSHRRAGSRRHPPPA